VLRILLTVPEKVQSLNVAADSRNIILNWTEPSGKVGYVRNYTIEWRAIIHESKSDIATVQNLSYVIGDLDACVMYEVNVTAVYVNNLSSEAEVRNVKMLTVGK
jgi:hypothetical protein